MPSSSPCSPVAIIGAGPAGLMAAEVLIQAGWPVAVYDAMPSPGRKFLRAGIGGLNLTHGEPLEQLVARYGERATWLQPWLTAWGPRDIRTWASGLGIDTFVGSSGRVFPVGLKAAPLLRAWLQRLRGAGVQLHTRHRWQGWDARGQLCLQGPDGEILSLAPTATLLALGGGSWPRLGSNGNWVTLLQTHGVAVNSLQPSNCGFEVSSPWSLHLQQQFAGAPLKGVGLGWVGQPMRKGDCMLTPWGVEGSLIYALSAAISKDIRVSGEARLTLDLLPDWSPERLRQALGKPQGKQSMARFLRRQLRLEGVKAALLRELAPAQTFADPVQLVPWIKALPLVLARPRPLAEAISSAGGVAMEALDAGLMLQSLPGVFCAGEMLDWDAPTGGYLLTACLATGRAAGVSMGAWLQRQVECTDPLSPNEDRK